MKRCFIWLFLCLLLAGCAGKRTVTPVKNVERIDHAVTVSNDQTGRLVREARKWLGTPYRYGGSTKAGTDCSGMVMELYREVYGLKLPRSSAQQRDYALPLNERDLVAGDLVFFATGRGNAVSHVGLYVGNGKMIHASTSCGVIESALNEQYYRRTFHSAGRIVSPEGSDRRDERREIRERIKRLEQEREQLIKLNQQIDNQIDSIYVTDPAIFD